MFLTGGGSEILLLPMRSSDDDVRWCNKKFRAFWSRWAVNKWRSSRLVRAEMEMEKGRELFRRSKANQSPETKGVT